MKNFIRKKSVTIFTLALISSAAMIQACGKGGSAITSSQSSCGYNVNQQYVCNTGSGLNPGIPGNASLFQLCSGPNFTGIPAMSVIANDGTQVCKVSFQTGDVNYNGIQEYLGPLALSPIGVPMMISVAQYDSVTFTASGSSNGSVCSSWGSFDAPLYADVYGYPSTAVAITGVLNVPAGISGIIGVGLNKSVQPHGCFMIDLKATITRCVDASGGTHSC